MASQPTGFHPTYDVLSQLYHKSDSEIKDLRKQLQESRKKAEEMCKRNGIARRPNIDVKQELAKTEEILAENQRKMSRLQERSLYLEKREKDMMEKVEEYKIQCKANFIAFIECSKAIKGISNRVKVVEESKKEIKVCNLDLEKRAETALEEVEQLKIKNGDNYNVFLKSAEEKKSASDRLLEAEESKKKIIQLKEDMEKLKKEELDAAKEATQMLKQEMDSVKKEVTEASQKNEDLQSTVSQLSREIKKTRFENQMEVDNMEKTISYLKKAAEELTIQNGHLKKKKGFFSRIFCCFRRRRARH